MAHSNVALFTNSYRMRRYGSASQRPKGRRATVFPELSGRGSIRFPVGIICSGAPSCSEVGLLTMSSVTISFTSSDSDSLPFVLALSCGCETPTRRMPPDLPHEHAWQALEEERDGLSHILGRERSHGSGLEQLIEASRLREASVAAEQRQLAREKNHLESKVQESIPSMLHMA